MPRGRAVALLLALPLGVRACGPGEGPDPASLLDTRAGTIAVALGARDLIARGQLQALPTLAPGPALERVKQLLLQLQQRVSSSRWAGPPTALLLVDAGHWARWSWRGRQLEMQAQAEGPEFCDQVVLTAEAVLQALLSGELNVAQAVEARVLLATLPPATLLGAP